MLIDCETRKPLGLLPGRDAGTLAAWLREHPGVEVICRDRAGSYAEGARLGAPQAVQVADRFHLWQNLGTAIEQCVRRHNECLRRPGSGPGDRPDIPFSSEPPSAKEMSPIETRIRERHAIVHALLDQGHGIREIARELHMGANTVRRCARTEYPEQLLGSRRQPRPSQLDPYKPYLVL
ncbi:transposase [Streptomyces sp. NBC_01210]|uniref:transposase n=1 Tax=Streptomyces sp. NBC_01210 TaxID=2903774 RepID=UPI002E11535B|nr:transposase [Streptomyces sp. NBC_01210]